MTHDSIPEDEPEERVTSEWKVAVKRWLAETERPQAFLARAVGCDPSLISLLLNTEQKASSVARRISEITGIPLPTETVDDFDRRILTLVKRARSSNPDKLRTIEKLVRAIVEDED